MSRMFGFISGLLGARARSGQVDGRRVLASLLVFSALLAGVALIVPSVDTPPVDAHTLPTAANATCGHGIKKWDTREDGSRYNFRTEVIACPTPDSSGNTGGYVTNGGWIRCGNDHRYRHTHQLHHWSARDFEEGAHVGNYSGFHPAITWNEPFIRTDPDDPTKVFDDGLPGLPKVTGTATAMSLPSTGVRHTHRYAGDGITADTITKAFILKETDEISGDDQFGNPIFVKEDPTLVASWETNIIFTYVESSGSTAEMTHEHSCEHNWNPPGDASQPSRSCSAESPC